MTRELAEGLILETQEGIEDCRKATIIQRKIHTSFGGIWLIILYSLFYRSASLIDSALLEEKAVSFPSLYTEGPTACLT